LEERLNTHDNSRPLLERHHLSYIENRANEEGKMGHEITVMLCRWCHAKVHKSGARINDEAEPDRNALELMEKRKSAEMNETKFESARERYNRELM
jgi:NMD protein affecting ribosome stability and mRNA decay